MGAWADGHRVAYDMQLGDDAPHPANGRTEAEAEDFHAGMQTALRQHDLQLSLFGRVIPLAPDGTMTERQQEQLAERARNSRSM